MVSINYLGERSIWNFLKGESFYYVNKIFMS